jgi:hypothetical protein
LETRIFDGLKLLTQSKVALDIFLEKSGF